MGVAATVAVEIDPAIRANDVLHDAVDRATSIFQEGLDHIDTASRTQTIEPRIRWSFDENDAQCLKLVYREGPEDGRTGFQSTMRRIPLSQILDAVGRRSWMLRLLQSVNGRRYDQVITRFEQMIRAREEAEADGQ